MRNVYLYIGLFMLFSIHCFGQGSDVIFWIDNSGSIDRGINSEWTDMHRSIDSIIHKVLKCNQDNKVAIVHYGSPNSSANSRIYIESAETGNNTGFTNIETIANSYVDRLANVGQQDFAHEALSLIGRALDNLPSANIVSPQKRLIRTPGNDLVIYLFTDADRNVVFGTAAGSCLVNATNTVQPNAFFNYTDFKNTRNATFVVTIVQMTTNPAVAAAAAIASTGGNYTGVVEANSLDPDGTGTTPRLLLRKDDFDLDTNEINQITDFICSVAEPPCQPIVTLTSPTNNVTMGQDNKQASISITASNIISTLTVGVYHAEETVVLLPGFHSQNASRFRAYIADCDSGYVGRPAIEEQRMASYEAEKQPLFSMYPNPAHDRVTLTAEAGITTVTITSIEGMLMYGTKLSGKETSQDVDVSQYRKGIYIVNITTADGKSESQKLVKD